MRHLTTGTEAGRSQKRVFRLSLGVGTWAKYLVFTASPLPFSTAATFVAIRVRAGSAKADRFRRRLGGAARLHERRFAGRVSKAVQSKTNSIMTGMEKLELLRAAIAIAMADGELRRSEKGVIEGLADRAGVGRMSLQAMMDAGSADDSIADNILMGSKDRARTALELLVGEARIDGEISQAEREVLVRIATSLRFTTDEFQTIYEAGLARADAIRKSRRDRATP